MRVHHGLREHGVDEHVSRRRQRSALSSGGVAARADVSGRHGEIPALQHADVLPRLLEPRDADVVRRRPRAHPHFLGAAHQKTAGGLWD